MNVKERYEELIRQVEYHDWRYYGLAEPEITDEEYDRLYNELLDFEKAHSDRVTRSSPSQRVGGRVSEQFTAVEHLSPMLSLANTYSFEEVEEFVERVEKGLQGLEIQYTCEPKIDGVAVSLRYGGGKLELGITRGDGLRGDEITENLRTVRGYPLEVKEGPGVGMDFEVRGEVYMAHEDFQRISAEREENGQPPFANPRNATAGSLKLLDSKEVRCRRLRMWVYDLIADDAWAGRMHSDRLKALEAMRFPVVRPWVPAENVSDIDRFRNELEVERDSFPFDLDGIVVKVNDLGQREQLGTTAKTPRWAMAYKFKARRAETELLEITHQVGRTGAVTPVAELEAVQLAGSTIRRATLHNSEEIARLGVGPGVRVILEKAGDVIPKIVARAKGEPEGSYTPPTECPVCGQPLVRPEGEVIQRCVNVACPAMLKARLTHYFSRGAMDIKGGPATVNLLVEHGLVGDPGDLYSLEEDQLVGLTSFAGKSARLLLESIEESKDRPLDRLIFALGIRLVGAGVARVLARKFRHLDELAATVESPEALENIEEVGPKIAASIVGFFSGPRNREVIRKLRTAGVSFGENGGEERGTALPLEDKSVVITGTFSEMTRDEISDLLRKYGARVSSSVSKGTYFLVVGSSPGSKLTRARELGVPLFEEKKLPELERKLEMGEPLGI